MPATPNRSMAPEVRTSEVTRDVTTSEAAMSGDPDAFREWSAETNRKFRANRQWRPVSDELWEEWTEAEDAIKEARRYQRSPEMQPMVLRMKMEKAEQAVGLYKKALFAYRARIRANKRRIEETRFRLRRFSA